MLAALAASCGAAGSFVLTTVVMDTIGDSVLVGFSCAAALLVALALQGSAGLTAVRTGDRRTMTLAAAGGALAFWAAPLLALSQRASDAPSGADSLFFTTSAWGLVCAAAAIATRSERRSVTALAGAAGALAGAAGLLASWEYPSSFSPFAKFPLREALMLAAGVAFAGGVVALAAAARRAGVYVAATAGLGAATVLGVLTALPFLPSLGEVSRGALLPCLYVGLMVAAFALGWTHASVSAGVSGASVSLFAAPVLVMALAGVERATSVYGPSPIDWPSALAASAVIVVGIVTIWLAEPSQPVVRSERRSFTVPLVVAGASSVAAVAALATPALDALAEGGTGEPFRAVWVMAGYESAAGWLAVAAAGLALAAVWAARSGAPARSWLSAAAAVPVCVVAAWPLMGTTLHTWNRWVPAEVQQTYGTEYSRLVTEARLEPVRIAAMLLAVLAVALLALSARRRSASDDTHMEVT